MSHEDTADPTSETESIADAPAAGLEEGTTRRGTGRTVIDSRNISVHYGETQALDDITM